MPVLRSRFLLCVCLLAAAALRAPAATVRAAAEPLRGRYIVTIASPTADVGAVAREVAATYDARLLDVWKYALRGFLVEASAENAALLAADKRVATVEQDSVVHVSGGESRPITNLDDYWHLLRLSYRQPLTSVSAPYKYQLPYDGEGVRVYQLDTGVRKRHQELIGQHVESGYNTVQDRDRILGDGLRVERDGIPNDPSPADDPCLGSIIRDAYHGTAVGSLLVGKTVGVAPGATLIPVTISACQAPSGLVTSTSLLLAGINYVAEQEKNASRPAVVNMSLYRDTTGSACGTDVRNGICILHPDLDVFETAVNTLIDVYGIPVVTSANNNAVDACLETPSRLSRRAGKGSVITVGGTMKSAVVNGVETPDARWTESNYGPCVDIFAPADMVNHAYAIDGDAGMRRASGTSFAAPIVTGVIARLMDEDPTLYSDKSQTATKVWQRLQMNATVLPPDDAPLSYRGRGPGSPNLLVHLGGVTYFSQPEPQSVGLNQQAELRASIVGANATLQWYQGEPGDTSTPVGSATVGTSSSQTLNPPPQPVPPATSRTTHYWMRATRGIYTGDSRVAVVTVGPPACPQPNVTAQPASRWLNFTSTAPSTTTVQTTIQTGVTASCYRLEQYVNNLWQAVPGVHGSVPNGVQFSVTVPAPADPALYRLAIAPGSDCTAANLGSCVAYTDVFRVRVCVKPSPPVITSEPVGAGVRLIVGDGNGAIGQRVLWYYASSAAGPWIPLRVDFPTAADGTTWRTFHDVVLYPPMPGHYMSKWANECNVSEESNSLPVTSCNLKLKVNRDLSATPSYAVSPTSETDIPVPQTNTTVSLIVSGELELRDTDKGDTERDLATLRSAPPLRSCKWSIDGVSQTTTACTLSVPVSTSQVSVLLTVNGQDNACFYRFKLTPPATNCSFVLRAKGPSDSLFREAAEVTNASYSAAVGESYTMAVRADATEPPAVQYAWSVDGVAQQNTGASFTLTVSTLPTVVRGVVTAADGCRREVLFHLVKAECSFELLAGRCQLVVSPATRVARNSRILLRAAVTDSKGKLFPDSASAVITWKDKDGAVIAPDERGNVYYTVGAAATDHSISVTASYDGCAMTRTMTVDVMENVAGYPVPTTLSCKMHAVRARSLLTSYYAFNPGEQVALSVDEPDAAATYEWYRALDGEPAQVIGYGSAIDVVMFSPAKYWYIETIGGEVNDSTTLTASPADSDDEEFTIEPIYQSIHGGDTATITAFIKPAYRLPGDVVKYEWRRGALYDASRPVIGTQSDLILPDLPDDAVFWCRILQYTTGANGELVLQHQFDTPFASVAVKCGPVGGLVVAHPPFVAAGVPSLVIAAPHGKLLTMNWYKYGADGVTTTPITSGQISAVNYTPEPGQAVTYIGASATDVCGNSGELTRAAVYQCVPTITQQPQSIIIPEGTTTTLVATATPAAGQTVITTWHDVEQDPNDLSSLGGGSSFVTPEIPGGTARQFRATFHTQCSADIPYALRSEIAVVEVCRIPAITPPAAEVWSTTPGGPVLIRLQASGTDLTYQWYEGTTGDVAKPLEGRVDSDVTVWPVTATRYWCRVKSRGVCVSDSPAVHVRVCSLPQITTQPQGARVFSDTAATLSVTASGGSNVDPIGYQWQQQGADGSWTNVAHADQQTFTAPLVTTTLPTLTFRVLVSAGACTTASDPATVSLCTYPQVVAARTAEARVGYQGSATLLLPNMTPVETKSITWYLGARGDRSHPLRSGTGTNLAHDTGPLTSDTQYWAEFTHLGCTSQTEATTVRVCIPQVTAQPASRTVPANTPAALTVGATAVPGQTYQWYFGSPGTTTSPVPNGAAASITVTPAATTSYWCRITTPCGETADSEAAVLTTCNPATISSITPPQSVPSGTNVTLGVAANGSNKTAQWYIGASGDVSTPITNGTGETLLITAQATRSYWCRITTDGICTADSPATTVSICTIPSITAQPLSQAIWPNTPATLSVTASSAQQPIAYQWYAGAQGVTTNPVVGATSSSVTVQPAATTSYWVRVTNGGCRADSAAATVSICALPQQVNAAPANQDLYAGQSVTLSLPAMTPVVDKNVTWYRGAAGDRSTPVASGLNRTYATPALTATTQYWAEFENGGCLSRTTTYTVSVCKPSITSEPQGAIVNANATHTMSVAATGSPLSYQWYRGARGDTTAPIQGATSNSFTTPPMQNDTTYWCRISGCGVNADSAAAEVTVCKAPSITAEPQDVIAASGGSVTFALSATGTELAYQWYRGASGDLTSPVNGATASSLTLSNVTSTADYWARVSGRCGTASSRAAKVSVPPAITTQPASASVTKGSTPTLSVAASGTQLSYKWHQRINGAATEISGATAASYTTPAVNAVSTYFCRVFSGAASRDSSDAVLTPCAPRAIRVVGYPNSRSGSDVTLAIDTPGADETYEWYSRTTPGGASTLLGTGTSILVRPLQTTIYWARTKRSSCDADGAELTVTICYPNITAQPQDAGMVDGEWRTLSVAATGTPTLAYQWYRGTTGDVTLPVSGATGASVSVSPSVTTSYWVRVSSPGVNCSSSYTDSATAVVSVCARPHITAQPESYNMMPNAQRTMSVTASGDNLHYQWYEGFAGDTSRPIGGDSSTYDIYGTTTRHFWVRVSNSCGYEDSVTTTQSVYPAITQQPVNPCGSAITMYVKATGAESYLWYRTFNGVTDVVGTTSTLTATLPGVPVTYWAQAISGNAATSSTTIQITTIKTAPTLNGFTASQSTATSWILSANVATADRPNVNYKFYQGALGSTLNLIADTSFNSKTVTPPTLPQKYWVRVYYLTGGCYVDRELTIP